MNEFRFDDDEGCDLYLGASGIIGFIPCQIFYICLYEIERLKDFANFLFFCIFFLRDEGSVRQ